MNRDQHMQKRNWRYGATDRAGGKEASMQETGSAGDGRHVVPYGERACPQEGAAPEGRAYPVCRLCFLARGLRSLW